MADILSLYELRNDSYKKARGIGNKKFERLINSLQKTYQSKAIMHVLTINNVPHMILTDFNCTEIIGEL